MGQPAGSAHHGGSTGGCDGTGQQDEGNEGSLRREGGRRAEGQQQAVKSLSCCITEGSVSVSAHERLKPPASCRANPTGMEAAAQSQTPERVKTGYINVGTTYLSARHVCRPARCRCLVWTRASLRANGKAGCAFFQLLMVGNNPLHHPVWIMIPASERYSDGLQPDGRAYFGQGLGAPNSRVALAEVDAADAAPGDKGTHSISFGQAKQTPGWERACLWV